MNIRKHMFVFLLFALSSVCFGRQWTATNGKTVEAEFVKYENEHVFLKLDSGKTVPVKREVLSDEDWLYVAQQDIRILWFFEKVGDFSAYVNKGPTETIPTTLTLFVSNGGVFRLVGSGFQIEFPVVGAFFRYPQGLHSSKYWEDCHETITQENSDGIECQVAEWDICNGESLGRHTVDRFYILKLNRDWKNGSRIPTESSRYETSHRDTSKYPILFIQKEEARKLGALDIKTSELLKQFENHPKILSLLKLAEKKREAAKAEKDKEFNYSNIRSTYDKFYNFTRYETTRDDLVVSLGINKIDLFSFRLYFVKNSSNELNMYARFLYVGSDWRFIKKLTLFSKGKRLEIVYPHDDIYTNVEEDGTVKEVGTTEIDPETLKDFIHADKIECRVSSDKIFTDMKFNTNMTMAFKEVLGYYFKLESEEAKSDNSD